MLAEMPTPEARSRVVGEGEGGDETTAIDEAAEQVVVERFRSTGEGLCIVSEELGELELRGGGFHVVIDPIDGSLNAKRGIPFFSRLARDRGRARGWATSSSATSATTARARSGGPSAAAAPS